jgi:hypothetical protein
MRPAKRGDPALLHPAVVVKGLGDDELVELSPRSDLSLVA